MIKIHTLYLQGIDSGPQSGYVFHPKLNQSNDGCYLKLVSNFIDGAADCFDNRGDAERVPSVILLLANCP